MVDDASNSSSYRTKNERYLPLIEVHDHPRRNRDERVVHNIDCIRGIPKYQTVSDKGDKAKTFNED